MLAGGHRERVDPRQARRVRDLCAAFLTVPIDGPPALEAHIAEVRDVLQVEIAAAYGVLDAGDHLDLRFLHVSANTTFDREQVREVFGGWLRAFPGKTGWAAYNALRPEREQRNRIFWTTHVAHARTRPAAQALYRRLGIQALDEMRALICDGPSLLAWVGVFQPETLAPWQHATLRSLIKPLRQRLIVERRLERHDVTKAALDVLLQSTSAPVFILPGGGAVEPGNDLARAALRADRRGTLEVLRAACHGGGDGSGYTVTPLDARGAAGARLAVARAPSAPLHRAKAAAARSRFRLSERQTDVLELLLQGTTGREISGALGIRPSTLEKHLAALYERVGVENRYALIARVTAL